MEPSKHDLHSERGQSLVELAVVLVILLVMLGGIVDVGRLLLYCVSLRDAAQEGVNYGSIKPSVSTAFSDTSDIVNRVQTMVGPTVTVDVKYGVDGIKAAKDACTGDRIQVVVTQPQFQFIMPLIGTFLGSNQISVSQNYNSTVLRPACP